MKHIVVLLIAWSAAGLLLGGCSSDKSRQQTAKKIYLTLEDYQEDLGKTADIARREAQPDYQADYVFNVYPQTEPNIYFFDKHQQPKVPGEFSDKDYQNEKRLWKKPRRYSPDEYYGLQGGEDSAGSGSENNYYDEP